MRIPARPSSARRAGALAVAVVAAAAVALAAYLLARRPQRTAPPAHPRAQHTPRSRSAIRAQFRPELLRSHCERLEDIDESDLLAEYQRAHRAAERARRLPFDRADPESLQLWSGHRDALAAEAARRYALGLSPEAASPTASRNRA
ncbi:hypothetical protein [Nocardia africana]|uniref:Uncharacterized protein n=1 Tax=Nocardia africana TaxID=134964 RepID=A0A379X4Q8_9NOCA|nr:hypothetical protein [Nocardia africana]MCC3318468.1 hypothetical protein [Nocardia africana]SUH71975.1 Uncharacterised protein [Nocardia africana]